ncbi:MAG: ParB N-terminal domain-containing protein [Methyloceanibacter sp.]|uniref:ParB N-terminal domain-containing protein n=1 Tax=Methyloceanibacter sp. TaxID=1965321 RepID=UPI003D9BC8C5
MTDPHMGNPATAETVNGAPKVDRLASAIKTSNSKWREQFKVHPAADVWPPMPEAELQALADDIKANGLRVPIVYYFTGSNEKMLIDGRNRLEAMERAGVELQDWDASCIGAGDDIEIVSKVIGLNAHRRHLNKQAKADLIVAATKAAAKINLATDGEVSQKVWIKSPCGTPLWETTFDTIEEAEAAFEARRLKDQARARKGGRGKKNKVKEKAVAVAKEHGISERTVERSIAKAEGKKPRPQGSPAKKSSLDLARTTYATELAEFGDDEMALIYESVKLDKARKAAIRKNRASTLPQDGRKASPRCPGSSDGRPKIDEAADFDAIGIDITETATKKPRKNCRRCHGAGSVIGRTGTPYDCDCVKRGR